MARCLSVLFAFCAFLCTAGQPFEACAPFGGMAALDRLFQQELHYPEGARDGNVLVIFNVLEDGTVTDLRTWRPLSPACDAEALRVARLIRWHPALMGGEKVAAEHFIAVPFDRKRISRWMQERHVLPDSVLAMPASTSLVIHSPHAVDRPIVPAIPGGWSGMAENFRGRMSYPPDALKRDIEGPVLVEFVVEPNGTLSNMRALRELGAGCNEEAFRLVEGILWSPAVKDGERVRSSAQVRIRFRLPR